MTDNIKDQQEENSTDTTDYGVTDEERAAIWDELNSDVEAKSYDYNDDTSHEVLSENQDDFATAEDESQQSAATADNASDGNEGNAEVSDNNESDPEAINQENVWDNATPEQRSALEAQQQDWKAQDRRYRGQISALQRQVNEMQKAQAQQAQASQGEQGQQLPSNQFLESDYWKEFKDEYEDVANPIGQVIGALQNEINQLKAQVGDVTQDQQQQKLNDYYDAETETLAKQHPDFESVFQDNKQHFEDWFTSEPTYVQEAAVRNSDNIVDAREAADIVSRFKSYLAHKGVTQTRAPNTNNGAGENDRLSNERQKKERLLASAQTPKRGKRAPVATGIPEEGDQQAIWDALEREHQRKNQHL